MPSLNIIGHVHWFRAWILCREDVHPTLWAVHDQCLLRKGNPGFQQGWETRSNMSVVSSGYPEELSSQATVHVRFCLLGHVKLFGILNLHRGLIISWPCLQQERAFYLPSASTIPHGKKSSMLWNPYVPRRPSTNYFTLNQFSYLQCMYECNI